MIDSDTPRTDEAVRLCSNQVDYNGLSGMATYMRALERDFHHEFAAAKAEIERLKAELTDAESAIRALVEALQGYTMVHGADDEDAHALALAKIVININIRNYKEAK